jgi:hypothetical protein
MEKYYTMPYTVIPLAAAMIGALTLYGGSTKDAVLAKGLWGVVICYGLTMLVVWQSYIHTFICSIGIRLIELECRINKLVGAGTGEGLQYFSFTLGDGYTTMRGLALTTAITSVFGLASFAGAVVLAYYDLHERFALSQILVALIIGLPIVTNIVLLINIWRTEVWAKQKKQELFNKYSCSVAEPSKSS